MHLFSNPDKMILNPYRFAAAGGVTTFGNNSREFDGTSDFLDIGAGLNIGTGDATLAAWCYFDSASGSMGVLDGGVFTASISVGIARINGNLQARFRYETGAQVISTMLFGTAAATWYHAAATFDRDGSMTVYLDGTSITSASISAHSAVDFNGPQGNAAIGNSGVGGTFKMDGKIADCRVYDRVLSGTEIADLAAGTDVASGLTGWWLTDSDDLLDYAGSNDGAEGSGSSSTYSTAGPLD